MRKYILFSAFAVLSLISCKQKTNVDNSNIDPSGTTNMSAETISDETSLYLLVGTYTTGESEGIYVYQFDTVSGFSKYKSVVKVTNPSYLTINKEGTHVYSVSETGDAKAAANAFVFDKKDGTLKLLNSQLTGGADPCYIELDKTDKHVVTANYSGGSITAFNINGDGTLTTAAQLIRFTGKGADAERQKAPHLHCVRYSPDGKYLFADDLGTDKIHKFAINESNEGNYLKVGTPAAFDVAPGSGPRHLDFHPNGKYAYLINELSGAVIAFNYDANAGNLTQIQTIQADTLGAKGSADIHVSPDGKFLYASNRLKGDGIAIFSINQADGKLTKVGYQETGVHPRNFVITPNGKFLLVASRDNDVIQIFLIDRATGLLENTYKDIELDMPVCLKFTSFK
ncbi:MULTISPECIES: lactonase family protein [Dysgonomonas]|uniref:lactonase family protein n=1 Tax=Dysgonomonas TaxID=156973 RepID=UPI00092AC72C|nr:MULTISPECIES: lactonase family protein [Dysgonomonas]MBN9301978.1 lactonase family protein [Dysgonomonas mossii]OJX61870.1 MAG: 6-phosphogluconolactonase [Dysgonomonas sp. 37-18]